VGAGITDPFVGFGPAARTKVLVLGSAASLPVPIRSLNLEHVSPARLQGPGISQRPADAVTEESRRVALLRRWFFARKPDAGFVLTDYPATLLQAKVFDEWLDARDESLSAVIAGENAPAILVDHYRSLGLLQEACDLAVV
jgi:adenylate kinase